MWGVQKWFTDVLDDWGGAKMFNNMKNATRMEDHICKWLYFTAKESALYSFLTMCLYLWIYYKDPWILNIPDHQSSVLIIFWAHTWITWFTESTTGEGKAMACARVPLDEQQVTEPGPYGKEHTLPALVRYCTTCFNKDLFTLKNLQWYSWQKLLF